MERYPLYIGYNKLRMGIGLLRKPLQIAAFAYFRNTLLLLLNDFYKLRAKKTYICIISTCNQKINILLFHSSKN